MSEHISNLVLPLTLEWKLTDSCNMRCRYCRRSDLTHDEPDYGETLERIIRLAPKHVWLGGGEPTLVRQLPVIAERLKTSLNVHIGLNTNLTRPDVLAELLPFIDDLIISLDTLDVRVNRAWRGVDPEESLAGVRMLAARAACTGSDTLFTVNSVVYRDSLDGRGIEALNDALSAVGRPVSHLLCPVYPHDHPDSIIGDQEAMDRFFSVVALLRGKGRSVNAEFPVEGAERRFAGSLSRCYRRFFRAWLHLDDEIIMPCPSASPEKPVCARPCNCARFIDNLFTASPGTPVDERLLNGRLTAEEAGRLRAFVVRYINPALPADAYDRLLSHRVEGC